MHANKTRLSRADAGGLLIGIGLGGFLDGIVLHQIAQWHSMLSNRIPPTSMHAMRVNMTADGWFHAAMWLATLGGIWLLHAAAVSPRPLPGKGALAGLLLLGWGAFNLVEGLIDHHLLQLHFVRQVPDHLAYDIGFLAICGVLPAWIGWKLWRRPHASANRGQMA